MISLTSVSVLPILLFGLTSPIIFGGNLKKLLQGDTNADGDIITPKFLVDNYGDMALWDMGFKMFKSQIDDSFIGRAVSEFGQHLVNVKKKN